MAFCERPVVQSLFGLIRFRNQHPAFIGAFSVPETPDPRIALRWDNGDDWAMLEVDLSSGSYSISSGWLLAVARVVVHQQHRQRGIRTGIRFVVS